MLGLSPLTGGSLVRAVGDRFHRRVEPAPRIVHRVRPAWLIGTGLAIAGSGLAILTRSAARTAWACSSRRRSSSPSASDRSSGSDHRADRRFCAARAGRAASGISETAIELGGALGISILGSIGIAIYRCEVARSIPASIPADAVAAARDTLGGATGVAAALPEGLAATLLDVARNAFVHGMQVGRGDQLVVAVAVAILAIITSAIVRPERRPGSGWASSRGAAERRARPVARARSRRKADHPGTDDRVPKGGRCELRGAELPEPRYHGTTGEASATYRPADHAPS